MGNFQAYLRSKLNVTRFWRGTGIESGVVTLNARRIYVMPTREGVAFAFVCLAVLAGSINYQTSLGFLLAFMLSAVGMVSAVHAQRNLVGLMVEVEDGAPVFAGEPARFVVLAENRSGGPKYSVEFRADLAAGGGNPRGDLPVGVTRMPIEVDGLTRGVHRLGRVTVETYFPLHLLRAWSPIRYDAKVIVYPKPAEDAGPVPVSLGERGRSQDEAATVVADLRGAGDFAGLREYAPGDPVARINWKATARSGNTMLKEFERVASARAVLDYDRLTHLDAESRLSVLASWVIEAGRGGGFFELRLGGKRIGPARGPLHVAGCLEALARFGGEGP